MLNNRKDETMSNTSKTNTSRAFVLVISVVASISVAGWLAASQQMGSFSCSQQASANNAWGDNKFSAATSGMLFQMRAWRRFAGARAFASAGVETASNNREPMAPLTPLRCATWAVTTTISSPTTTVLQLAKLAEEGKLCLVAVGDRKTPPNYTLGKNAVYLSPADQEKLPYAIIKHLPWGNVGRKNVGYVYAIHHGASYIYDTDDDNELVEFKVGQSTEPGRLGVPVLTQKHFGTLDTDHHIHNAYPCFWSENSHSQDYAFSWPRGYPLESIKDPGSVACAMHNATQSEFESVAIIQSLADHDPDVDAVYRLTRTLPITFRSPVHRKDAAILPRGTFSPYNAQATLNERRAFWGLLLPVTVHARVSDIWRSYYTQSIMWRAGLTLAMARPWVIQKRNAHHYLGDLQSEQNLYYQAGAIVQYLSTSFDFSDSSTIPGLIESMYIAMYERGILEVEDVKLAQAWLSDLQSIGYKYPNLRSDLQRAPGKQSAGGVAEVEGPLSTASGTVFKRPTVR